MLITSVWCVCDTNHGLQVNLWVPVRVKENDNVGRGQVDAQTTRACTQHEDKLAAARRVVLVDRFLTNKHTTHLRIPLKSQIQKCYTIITGCKWQCQTIPPVQEINLNACMRIIINEPNYLII